MRAIAGAMRLATPAVALLGLALAWRRRFVQDDAFISFLYARNLVEGHGLTWFGERVEGYTNFLWVLWIALGIRLGADPIPWSYAGGLGAFAAALHAAWRLGGLLTGAGGARLVLFALVTNASFVAFATGGLETMLQTALLAQASLRLARLEGAQGAPRLRSCVELSLLAALAVLARPDSALPAAVFVAGAAWLVRRAGAPVRRRAQTWLVLPAAALLGAHGAWRLAYYGDVVPNTWHAKVSWSPAVAAAGALYVWRWLWAYALWAGIAAAVVVGVVRRRKAPQGFAHPVAWASILVALLAWIAYVVALGGDFMEFRMLVPATPFLFLLVAGLVAPAPGPRGAVALILAAALAAVSLHHARSFRGMTEDKRLDSVQALSTFYDRYPDRDWGRIGRRLRAELAGTGATLALHAVGAIPYYSRLPTVDMYGLSDRHVARTGNRALAHYRRPGHQRQIRLTDLRQRGVNFVIAHPTLLPPGMLADPRRVRFNEMWVRVMISFGTEPIGRVTLAAMPIDAGTNLMLWYLTPTPALDAILHERGWETVTLTVSR